MRKALFTALLLLLSCPVQAVEQNAFVYSKTILKIIPKASEPDSVMTMEGKNTDAKKNDPAALIQLPELKRSPKEFKVEVRDQAFLDQRDFIVHQPFSDKEGMMILIDPPAPAQLKSTRMIATADVLFVDGDGIIFKIAPELGLLHLSEPIESGKPMHAFIYLKAGTASGSDIELGDRIENISFKTHPVVIE